MGEKLMTHPDHASDRGQNKKHVDARHAARLEAMLDEALEETYPASDPLPVQPGICRTRQMDGQPHWRHHKAPPVW
jgi:hypothetical protein